MAGESGAGMMVMTRIDYRKDAMYAALMVGSESVKSDALRELSIWEAYTRLLQGCLGLLDH